MTASAPGSESERHPSDALREQLANRLRASGIRLAPPALATLPAPASRADLAPLAASLTRLMAEAVRTGRSDARDNDLIGLAAFVDRLGLTPADVFAAVYGMMVAAVSEVCDDPALASAEDRSQASDLVRRAAFDVLAAWTARTLELPTSPAITDGLTTLHSRVMFDTVLAKECQRAERFEHWLSLLLIEVSDFADINRTRGYGVSDQVLERVAILIRRYFRQHDWVARYGDHAVAVLLPETGPEDAQTLARLMQTMIQERVAADDERQRPVQVSVAVASARPLNGYPVDADRILDELDTALERASTGNDTRTPADRIEFVEIHPVVELTNQSPLEP